MRHLRHWYVYGPIAVAIIGLLLWRARVWDAGDLLKTADSRPLLVAVLINAVVIVSWAVRSHDLLKRLGWTVSVQALVPIVNFANTINGITPASAGEVLRAVMLRQRHDVAYRDGAAIILLERVYALGLIFVSSVACFVVATFGGALGALTTIGAVVLAISPIVIYRRDRRFSRPLELVTDRLPSRWHRPRHLVGQLRTVEDQVAAVLKTTGAALVFIAVSAVIFVTMDVQLLLVAQAVGVSIDPIQGWAALGLGAMAGVISALPFGLGALDAVIAIVLVSFGTDAAAAALITVLLRLVATLPTGLFGAASFVYLNRTDPARTELASPVGPLDR